MAFGDPLDDILLGLVAAILAAIAYELDRVPRHIFAQALTAPGRVSQRQRFYAGDIPSRFLMTAPVAIPQSNRKIITQDRSGDTCESRAG
jgi:hypothetical protein